MIIVRPEVTKLYGESAFKRGEEADAIERTGGLPVLRSYIGQINPSFIYPGLSEAHRAVVRDGLGTGYAGTQGNRELREEIADKYYGSRGIMVMPDEIIIAPEKSALYLWFMSAVQRGDKVVYPNPGYPAYPDWILLAGAQGLVMPEINGRPDLEKLEALLAAERPQWMIICSPGNPTGVMLTPDEVESICRMANEYSCTILSDEAYNHIVFCDRQSYSMLEMQALEGNVVVFDGLSKTGALPGWRLGWCVISRRLFSSEKEWLAAFKPIVVHYGDMVSCMPPIFQLALLRVLKTDFHEFMDYVKHMVVHLQIRCEQMVDAINRCPYLTCNSPEGGLYVWPKVRNFQGDDRAFDHWLLHEKHIAALPGQDFGKYGKDRMRFCYATMIPEEITELGNRLSA